MRYNNTGEIWDELRHLCPDFYTVPRENGRAKAFISSGRVATRRMPSGNLIASLKRSSIPQRSGAVLHLRLRVAYR